MSAITIGDDLVHYEVLGRGRPVILIHGWLGSWRYWIPTMQHLSMKFRSYALDLWGFGDTSKDPDQAKHKYRFDEQVKLVGDFMDKLGIGKAALVGHALGAAIAIEFAARNPDRVPRLVGISTPVTGDLLREQMILGGTPSSALLGKLVGRDVADYEALDTEAKKSDREALHITARYISGLPAPGEDKSGQEPTPIDLRPSLTRILENKGLSTLCLLIHGQNDPLVAVCDKEHLGNLDGHPRFVQIVLETSKHFPMLDSAAKFNRLLLEFLELDPSIRPLDTLRPKEQWRRRMR